MRREKFSSPHRRNVSIVLNKVSGSEAFHFALRKEIFGRTRDWRDLGELE